MIIVKNCLFYWLFLLVFIFVLLNGCGRDEKQPAETGQVSDSTMVVQQSETTAAEGLVKHTEKVESRLADLLSLIEEKEEALLVKEAELVERENRVVRLQIISWIIFGIGITGCVLILLSVIIRKKNNKLKTDVEGLDNNKNLIMNMEVKLREAQVKIDLLKAKADKAKNEKRMDYRKLIKDLQVKCHSIQENMNELRQSKGEGHDDILNDMKKTFSDLEIELKGASRIIK